MTGSAFGQVGHGLSRLGNCLDLMTLNTFCRQHGLDPESGWHERALAALAT